MSIAFPSMSSRVECFQEKHAKQEAAEATSATEGFIAALREGRITEELATLMHRMLKTNPDMRSKWLGGLPLRSVLLETPWPSVYGPRRTPKTL